MRYINFSRRETMNTETKTDALAFHLELAKDEADDIETSGYDESLFEYESEEYLVLTDAEANARWEEALDNYLEEVILPELPEFAARYFDEDKWKRDARFDGRGHSLSPYDGDEIEGQDGLYIYRIN
jgi:hypothetical protein